MLNLMSISMSRGDAIFKLRRQRSQDVENHVLVGLVKWQH